MELRHCIFLSSFFSASTLSFSTHSRDVLNISAEYYKLSQAASTDCRVVVVTYQCSNPIHSNCSNIVTARCGKAIPCISTPFVKYLLKLCIRSWMSFVTESRFILNNSISFCFYFCCCLFCFLPIGWNWSQIISSVHSIDWQWSRSTKLWLHPAAPPPPPHPSSSLSTLHQGQLGTRKQHQNYIKRLLCKL